MGWPFGASLHFEIDTFKDRVLKILFYTLSREVRYPFICLPLVPAHSGSKFRTQDSLYLARLRIQPYRPLVTVLEAILTSRQPREKLRCLYENLMSSNFRKTAVLKKILIAN